MFKKTVKAFTHVPKYVKKKVFNRTVKIEVKLQRTNIPIQSKITSKWKENMY